MSSGRSTIPTRRSCQPCRAARRGRTTGINDRGEILGAYEGRDRVIRHFVRDRKGRFDRLEDPPGGSGIDEYVDLNNRGEMVGFYNDDQGVTTTGFLRTKRGRFIDVVVPGSVVTGPLKINDRRQVVGIYVDEAGSVHGFLWDDGEFSTIDVPRATGTAVLGINNRGQMVGSYIDADGAYHGFLRERNGRVVTLPEAPGAQPAMGGTQPCRDQRPRPDRRPRLRRPRRVARLPARGAGRSRMIARPRRRLHPRHRHRQPGPDRRPLRNQAAGRPRAVSRAGPGRASAVALGGQSRGGLTWLP